MQPRTVVVGAVMASLVVLAWVGSADAASLSYQKAQQGKPRTIRGFKNVVLSTARNFGKRAGSSTEGEFVDEAALQANPEFTARAPVSSFPAQWFVDELQNNPELAKTVVRKFIDENQDGELSAEELLRPVY